MAAAAALVATAVIATGPGGESSPTVSAASDGFVSMAPTRVLDTRTDSGPVTAGESVTATLTGIPADAAAAVVNVTAANATGNGYLTVWNCDGDAPGTSNGNFVGIDTVAANVITAIGDNNEICVQAGDADTEIIVDQMGYFAAGSGVDTITPSRVLDTRTSTGPVTPGTTTTITLNDLADDAKAAIVNITATNAAGDGYFTAWNCDGDAPDTSNGNYVGVTTIANTAIVELGDASTICVTTGDAAADLLIDVFGYFTQDSGYTPVTPTRALDTRTGATPVQPGVTTKINLADVPAGDAAIVNITATGATGDGYFTAWNCDGDAPDTSNGNYVGVTTIANSAIITTNPDGDICIQTGQNAADILIDTYANLTTTPEPGPGPGPGPEPAPGPGPKPEPDPTPWATSAGGTDWDEGSGVSTLSDGSAIITGRFDGTATFGDMTLTSAGSDDVFVAKIDADGTWDWATQAGGTGSDFGAGVSTLSDGSAIITGGFRGTATFGDTTLTSAGSDDVFVARITADGTWDWATQAGGAEFDYGFGVSTLSDGSAIITGRFRDTATFGDTPPLTSDGREDVFVAKITATGIWDWATSAGGADVDEGFGVSTLSDGSAIITGGFQGMATFGDTPPLNSNGSSDVFVAKITANGTWDWATSVVGTGRDNGSDVSTLSDGSAIITGWFEGTATFGGTTLTSAGGGGDVFVAQISANGTWDWATRAGGADFVSGYGVSTLSDGSAIITGGFAGSATFGDTTLNSAGSDDVFVAKITADGTWDWATPAGGADFDYGYGVSTLSNGSAIITGQFENSATFGDTTLTSAGGGDVFVAKISPTGSFE
jgi:hypothetical protein